MVITAAAAGPDGPGALTAVRPSTGLPVRGEAPRGRRSPITSGAGTDVSTRGDTAAPPRGTHVPAVPTATAYGRQWADPENLEEEE
ncbi:hypothetical protein GCM10010249_12270 [Streptomyces roseolilacinus]|uniref:Uncharacterized protein n=1 Tax=Streptomyces roseolilacinus TaxID=66904 RepID=A0A918AWZ0_9ACTN|nr:hypothetical protein GCM10010249_12270 [Streptomyces roseolilacinus]